MGVWSSEQGIGDLILSHCACMRIAVVESPVWREAMPHIAPCEPQLAEHTDAGASTNAGGTLGCWDIIQLCTTSALGSSRWSGWTPSCSSGSAPSWRPSRCLQVHDEQSQAFAKLCPCGRNCSGGVVCACSALWLVEVGQPSLWHLTLIQSAVAFEAACTATLGLR